jgi:hypothetical protein
MELCGEPALQLIETNEVETKALSIMEKVRLVRVIDAPTYIAAGEMFKDITAIMKEVEDSFDKNIKLWHEGHKNALADKAKHWNPLDAAKRAVKKLMSDYDLEQERIRQAEQRRLEELARKAEEERLLQEAIMAEEEAKANGATKEEAEQVAATIIEEPVYVAPVTVQKATPKLAGGPVYRTVWKFRIKDAHLIPRQYMIPNEVAIGSVVRSLKNQANIPGIEPYEERV